VRKGQAIGVNYATSRASKKTGCCSRIEKRLEDGFGKESKVKFHSAQISFGEDSVDKKRSHRKGENKTKDEREKNRKIQVSI